MNLIILQKEWLDKCEQAKRAKLVEENSVDAPDNDKHPKEDKATPSRSMSLESNTLGKIKRFFVSQYIFYHSFSFFFLEFLFEHF